MARIIYNPRQTQKKALEEYPGDHVVGGPAAGSQDYIPTHRILFDRENGYAFSDDKNMDRVVKYFVEKKGFKVKSDKEEEAVEVVKPAKPKTTGKKTTGKSKK